MMPTEKELLGHFLWTGIGWFGGMDCYDGEIIAIPNVFIRMPVFREAREPLVYVGESASLRGVIQSGLIVSGSSSYLFYQSHRS